MRDKPRLAPPLLGRKTFTLTPDGPVQMSHVAMGFADPNDAANTGCAAISTPFDGDGVAGILVLSAQNFPDNKGPASSWARIAAMSRCALSD